MSMRELLNRYAKGMPLDGEQKTPIYDEDGTSLGIDVRKLDLVDLQEMQMDNAHSIGDLQDKIKQAQKRKQSKQMDLEDAIVQPEGH